MVVRPDLIIPQNMKFDALTVDVGVTQRSNATDYMAAVLSVALLSTM